jgi:hypothetical protein
MLGKFLQDAEERLACPGCELIRNFASRPSVGFASFAAGFHYWRSFGLNPDLLLDRL